jgi:1,5-anhydro-D-fructose reductase (1,5-anhydro-D-mannitol-forming)
MKWGLIGASTIAREWMIEAIRSVGDEVVAVVSSDERRAELFAKESDIKLYGTDINALLANSEIDAVYISTQNHLHKEQSLLAIQAGKHVMCEKPLALSVEDARQMIDAAHAAGVVFATNHHLRNAATHTVLREAVQSGLIGKPLAAKVFHAVALPAHLQGWRISGNDNGGGVILDISVHDVDTLRYILCDDPQEVTALTQSGVLSKNGLADSVMGVIRFKSGLIAQFHDSFTTEFAHTGLEIIGTKGTLIARDVMTQQPIGEVVLWDAEGTRVLPLRHVNLYEVGLQKFREAVEGRAHPAASGVDGIWSLATGLAVVRAAQTGQVTPVVVDLQ